jgi:hypothetical protein
MPDLISRFARSWQLIQASREVLSADNALLILPAISGLATTTLAAGFVSLAISNGAFDALHESRSLTAPLYAWLFCWYVVQYFVVIFFNTALVGAAIAVLGGGRPTVRAALKLALSRVGVILGYAVISATIGILLNAVAPWRDRTSDRRGVWAGLDGSYLPGRSNPCRRRRRALAGDRAQHRAVA